jgi:phosphoribosylaminoimidazole-succinocarboxamide synthase
MADPLYMSHESVLRSLPESPLLTVEGLSFPLVARGKVRDIFDAGEHLLIVATDRISAFDVILNEGVPGKGIVLTQMSLFWFGEASTIVRHHLVENHTAALRALLANHPHLIPRSMLVRKLRPLPIEAVVRGYLSGSGWRDYVRTGTVFGQRVPAGLEESAKLPFPLFTPTTKAEQGAHDEAISLERCAEILGAANYEAVRDTSIRLFALGSAAARQARLLLADTKFEFGLDDEGSLHLIDEVLTPDSSRFWPEDGFRVGGPQQAFDKQFVRDYLETLSWDKTPPPPPLPRDVITGTRDRYLEALRMITSVRSSAG